MCRGIDNLTDKEVAKIGEMRWKKEHYKKIKRTMIIALVSIVAVFIPSLFVQEDTWGSYAVLTAIVVFSCYWMYKFVIMTRQSEKAGKQFLEDHPAGDSDYGTVSQTTP